MEAVGGNRLGTFSVQVVESGGGMESSMSPIRKSDVLMSQLEEGRERLNFRVQGWRWNRLCCLLYPDGRAVVGGVTTKGR